MTADTHPKQERTISLRVPQTLADKVKTASEATNLKQSDLLRLALDRGVDVLVRQLQPTD